jgi:tetratricopeptide (TPR) repeat protein
VGVLVEDFFRAERMSRVARENARLAEAAAARARNDADLARRAQTAEAQLHEQVEARLAVEAKMRANNDMSSMLSKAGLLFSQREYKKAEELVNQMPPYPASAAMYNSLGLIHAGRAEWRSAIQNYSKVVELAPSDHVAYHCLAPLLVQIGDLDGFGRHRERVLRQFAATADPMIAERMARDCLLLPPPTEDLEAIGKMVATAAAKQAGEWVDLLKGLAEYRAGRFASAAVWLQKLANRNGQGIPAVQGAVVLAMAQYQLRQPAEARATLARGRELARAKLPKLVPGNLDPDWNEVMTSRALIREARELIETGAASDPASRTSANDEDF